MQSHLERIVEINTRIAKRVTTTVNSFLRRYTESGTTRTTEDGQYRISESETK